MRTIARFYGTIPNFLDSHPCIAQEGKLWALESYHLVPLVDPRLREAPWNWSSAPWVGPAFGAAPGLWSLLRVSSVNSPHEYTPAQKNGTSWMAPGSGWSLRSHDLPGEHMAGRHLKGRRTKYTSLWAPNDSRVLPRWVSQSRSRQEWRSSSSGFPLGPLVVSCRSPLHSMSNRARWWPWWNRNRRYTVTGQCLRSTGYLKLKGKKEEENSYTPQIGKKSCLFAFPWYNLNYINYNNPVFMNTQHI